MKKTVSLFLIVLLSFCFVGCGEEKFTTPGYDTLFNYCENPNYLSQNYIKVVDSKGEYYHKYVIA